MGRIVVGFDGSKAATEALRWAADEAEHRSWSVRVVESWKDPVFFHRSWMEVLDDPWFEERQARAELDGSVAAVVDAHPDVTFTTDLTDERPSRLLTEESEQADLVVVGARGRGGFARLLLGSVSQKVASRAASTVVVVRDVTDGPGEVVVGVDGGEPSRRALTWAAEVARHRHRPLRVVTAWSWLRPIGEQGSDPYRDEYSQGQAEETLRAVVDGVLGSDPGLAVQQDAVLGPAAAVLVERARGASLLVVGPRSGSMTSPTLASVALQVLHHAPCPVAIVRPSDAS